VPICKPLGATRTKMRTISIIFLSLLFGCSHSESTNEQSESSHNIEKDSISLTTFLKHPCKYTEIEFNNIYIEPQPIKADSLENLVVLDYLKSKGFDVLGYGRGNWEKGPRIISYEVTNYFCDCQVDKLFYSSNLADKYRTTERVKCSQRNGGIDDFIPEGYEILDSVKGLVNDDSLTDVILVLKMITEVATEEKRPILVLLKTDYGYYLNTKNENYMLSWDGGGVHGDPYDRIELDNKKLTIVHFGGSSWKWSQEMNFYFDDDRLEFIPTKYVNRSFWSLNPDSTMNIDSIIYDKEGSSFSHFTNPYNE